MKPKRIILMRHGQSEGNADHSMLYRKPDYALNLTAEGTRQARLAAQNLLEKVGKEKFFIYSSPFYRTRQTVNACLDILNVTGVREDPRLREHERTTVLRASPEKEEKYEQDWHDYHKFYYRFKGGESCADVYDRISSFLDTLFRDFKKPKFPDNALIVGHGTAHRVFLMRWFNWSPERFELIRNPKNCQCYILEQQKNGKYILAEPLEFHPSKMSKF